MWSCSLEGSPFLIDLLKCSLFVSIKELTLLQLKEVVEHEL